MALATFPSTAAAPSALKGKIKFKDGSGAVVFSIKPAENGAKLVDASEKELARLTVDGEKIKIKDADDKTLGYITSPLPKFKVKDPEQTNTLYAFQFQDDGDAKLEDSDEATLVKLKHRDYGIKAVDGQEKDIFKVKAADGKTSIRGADDKTKLYTKDAISPMAAAALGLESLPLHLRVGLLLKITYAGK